MDEKYNIDDIESYINGEMSEADRISFEKLIREDPDLEAEVQFYTDVVKAMEIQTTVKNLDKRLASKGYFEKESEDDNIIDLKVESSKKRIRLVQVLSIAAAILVLLVTIKLINENSNETLTSDLLAEISPSELNINPNSLLRGQNEDENILVQTLKNEQYGKVIEILDDLDSLDINQQIILAMAYIKQKEYEKAQELTKGIIESSVNNNTLNIMKLEWIEVKAKIGLKSKPKEVLQTLEEIANDSMHQYSSSAKDLIQKYELLQSQY